jgi:long-chain acyl-CoA synthetase
MKAVIAKALSENGIPADIEIDEQATLVSMFEQSVVKFGDRDAISSLGHTLTFEELGECAKAFAVYLQQHTNLQPGDRIGIQLPNLIQYPVVLFGSLMAGLVVVNINPLYQNRELEHQLVDSGTKAVVVLANIAKTLEEVVPKTSVEKVIVTELADLHPLMKRLVINLGAKYIKSMVPKLSFEHGESFNQALQLGRQGVFKPVTMSSQHLAVLQYTGGTTGVAKGAMLSHRNLLANILQCQPMFESFSFRPCSETVLMPLPLYHIYSFILSMLVLVNGNHSVLIPNPRDIRSLIKEMARYEMTMFCGINSLFVKLCAEPEFKRLDFSSLRMTLSGGMALTANAAEVWEAVTGSEIYQGYGMTETSPVISMNPGHHNQPSTIGLPVSSTEIKLINEEGGEARIGDRGELCVRGPQVMLGYWNRPEATAEMIDADGWLATGDIAIVGEDGYLSIVDRKKDMIITSGFKIYPNEVEDVLSNHPNVVECAAVGIPDDVVGETIKVFVVVNGDVSTEELDAFCREHLTGYKIPKAFAFVDELPKSAVGKVLRRELK